MSTRANIHFCHNGEVSANIYQHPDGYPDGEHGVPARLEAFFNELEAQTSDTRYGDPEYLAAKFLVWKAREYARDPEKPLDFLSISPCVHDHGDIEWVYTVECSDREQNGRPKVSWEAA